ncbi:predicted protein [Scheffersomyces stipitis CBS 6054]|uniref:Transmembrane protein 135 N-terminal domain-containing protein n=1 Tax=Scheffersomyces stipitis (strain ATCC 58785 / CBS 6054 / NBRC 10063 / NRRL Y-11545) TaxID=322104 RepID=A3LT40_PICST|nr:predicted protein [Scheffersomyces stipitis CBS 6054]ABN66343.2 predicted protein [Scheffersomyces stipitis CBS 6054]
MVPSSISAARRNAIRSSIELVIRRGLLSRSTRTSFILAFIYVVLPKLIRRSFSLARKGKVKEIPRNALHTIIRGLHHSGFPVFIGRMVATLNILSPIVKSILVTSKVPLSKSTLTFLTTFIASSLSSLINFPSFQKRSVTYDRYYTLDMTLVLATRALDTLVSTYAPQILKHYHYSGLTSLSTYGDALLFIVSSYFIMDTWFSRPERLTPGYRNWISASSHMDEELVTAFRQFRCGELHYIKPGEKAEKQDSNYMILQDYCKSKGMNPSDGDLSLPGVIPCRVLHGFSTDSCIKHVLIKFGKSFTLAFNLYGTLNLIMFLIRRGSPKKYLLNTIRSSVFLGSFTALDWLFLCSFRKLSYYFTNVSNDFWECASPNLGSMACGFSIFVESPHRRKELSLYVAPKAIGTFLSAEPTERNLRLETLAFSLSFGLLVAYARADVNRVRGLVGGALGAIFRN